VAYGSDEGLAAYLASMGYVLPTGAPSAAVLRARGSAYLDGAYEGLWTGQRTGGVMQADGWPRTGAKIGCVTDIADDVIPLAVINAAYRAAWLEASAPGALSPAPVIGARVKRERVEGAVEQEFFDDGKASAGAAGGFIDPAIDGAMQAFICANTGSGLFLMSVGS
jgi:hypothetical protein